MEEYFCGISVKDDWGRWGIKVFKEIVKKLRLSGNPPTCLYDFLNLASRKYDIEEKLENTYGCKVPLSSEDRELIYKGDYLEILKYIKKMELFWDVCMKLRWPFIVVEGYFRIIVGLLKENRVERDKEIIDWFNKYL